jgi:hypothetical protein
MPDSKISALPSGIPAQAGDQFPIARSGLNYSLTPVTLSSVFTNLGAWQAVQTSSFTAAVGKAYPINTTSAAITVTLPSSATFGDVIYLADYAGTFATNNLTIDPNYSTKLNNSLSPGVVSTNRAALQLVYSGLPQGWLCYTDTIANLFAEAFTIQGLVVAGGGGSGLSPYSAGPTGAGGGGFRTYLSTYPLSPSPGTIETGTVTVGAGGNGGNGAGITSGANSVLNTITSAGGGKGTDDIFTRGSPGGSGGGSGWYAGAGGDGNVPATTPSQGNPGSPNGYFTPGGGGGAGTPGGLPSGAGATLVSAGGLGAINTLLGTHTSSTSNTIGTGSKTFTIATSAGYSAGEPIRIYNSSTVFMDGNITSYNSGTGALVLNSIRASGSGTYTSWTVVRCYAGGGASGDNGTSNPAGSGGGGQSGPGVTNSGGGAGGSVAAGATANGGSGVVLISVPNTGSVTFSGGVTSTMTTVGTKKVYKVTATSTTSETYTVTVP